MGTGHGAEKSPVIKNNVLPAVGWGTLLSTPLVSSFSLVCLPMPMSCVDVHSMKLVIKEPFGRILTFSDSMFTVDITLHIFSRN